MQQESNIVLTEDGSSPSKSGPCLSESPDKKKIDMAANLQKLNLLSLNFQSASRLLVQEKKAVAQLEKPFKAKSIPLKR